MKRTFNFMKLAFLVIALISISCSPEDGRDGEQGSQGVAGQDGQDGTDGNANVVASPWFDEEFPNTASTSASFNRTDTAIDQDVANAAAFLVYGKRFTLGGTDIIVQLPVTDDERTYFYELFPQTNRIFFRAESVDKTTQFIFDDYAQFRFVIIPSNNSTGKGSSPDFSKMSYEEVMDYFGLTY
ncbi:hypothetical protein [Spongiivirga citrea]|uniref:Collagen-like protein n=1 Tax=Spongiivirga citrea TaxID=1481457 RepID=A0A6M0CJW0_9FLAO|nr:hypothetical protein [Spongiivirga citrea]NER17263.1 hypothetical protein [Spongiivirga citrea]